MEIASSSDLVSLLNMAIDFLKVMRVGSVSIYGMIRILVSITFAMIVIRFLFQSLSGGTSGD